MTSLAYTAFRGDAISTDLDIDGLVKVLTSDEEAAKNILVTLGYVVRRPDERKLIILCSISGRFCISGMAFLCTARRTSLEKSWRREGGRVVEFATIS